MKWRSQICIFSIIMTLQLGISHAALIDVDWQVPGDSSLILDTSTGLEWLDHTLTLDRAYNDVASQLSVGGDFEGFRYATLPEVMQLWASAGIADTQHIWIDNGQWPAVSDLAERLGISVLVEPEINGFDLHAMGMIAPPRMDGFLWVPELAYEPETKGAKVRTSTDFYTLEPTFHSPHYASYLVRPTSLLVAPSISGFWPSDGVANSLVFVFGSDFRSISGLTPQVCVNGLCSSAVQLVADDLLIFFLPAGDTNGLIEITTEGGVATSPTLFGSPCSGLSQNGIWPSKAQINELVFVFGCGLISTTESTLVDVNGVPSFAVQVIDESLLLFFVPVGASTGPVNVHVGNASASSPVALEIIP